MSPDPRKLFGIQESGLRISDSLTTTASIDSRIESRDMSSQSAQRPAFTSHPRSRRGRLVQCVMDRPITSGYTSFVTRTLDAAIARLATLSPDEQDRVGHWLLDELRDEEHWGEQFRESRDSLSKLAAEARTDRTAGRTTALDPEQL